MLAIEFVVDPCRRWPRKGGGRREGPTIGNGYWEVGIAAVGDVKVCCGCLAGVAIASGSRLSVDVSLGWCQGIDKQVYGNATGRGINIAGQKSHVQHVVAS